MSNNEIQKGKHSTYVCSDTVVPEDDSVRLPARTDLAVDAAVDMVVEEVQDGI